LSLLAFGRPGEWLRDAGGGPWWAQRLELTPLGVAGAPLGRLRVRGWGGGALLTAMALRALVWTARTWPSWWPVVAAPGAALLTLALTLVAPLLFERLFNRFWP